MISILIPVFNYNVVPLVYAVNEQIKNLQHPYEIIVLDDHSTNLNMESANSKIGTIPQVTYLKAPRNKGRSATRHALAQAATSEWLLFLDADVMPSSPQFIKKYLENHKKASIVYGGITYTSQSPKDHILRYKYGREREAQPVAQRLKNPYISIISQGFLINKNLFLKVNPYKENRYGLDVLFTHNLKKEAASVLHIDNPVVHEGLETGQKFIEKSEKAVQSLLFLTENGQIPEDHYRIQKVALRLRKWKLSGLFTKSLAIFKKKMVKNLLSKNPSLFIFDVYRLHKFLEKQKPHA
ncbi:glycosyltransferase family 2 protein [Flavimarina sp. Hel_I_48]|uniref:glycosyltransferase family 2 protein n=1 Tax=Flavimarina sp. Hel_I_48 TaxID=1392488 RepID=UPI00055FE5BF|nr:glycosyltransferase family 2 protein [Flavimarina sp. Hel_I_48]